MTTVRTARWLKTTTALTSAFGLAVALAPNASANPTGGQVAAGQATISAPDTRTLQIDQTSRNAVIEWRSFDIEVGETTRFVQPDNQSWTLNRVTGETAPSHILGTLEANGNVAIVNPDGILFGRDARVDVGGLIATTHDEKNDDFMAGRFQFNRPGNPSASIVNEGSISIADYGLGAFVAPGVRNSGVITARLGSVSLASGNAFSLDLYGDNLVHLLVDDEIAAEVLDVATGKPVTDLVKNEGRISADGGTVALTAATARRAVNSVVNNSGIIEANSVSRRGGKIVLGAQTAGTKKSGAPTQRVKVSGQLLATNVPIPTPRPDPAMAGHIAILGEHIEVANATIDASGEEGGGTVLIGGDYMGGHGDAETIARYGIRLEDTPIPTATYVAVDAQSVISADALVNGDGGKVVIWSDEVTATAATISARGGANNGDGGFVETSGKRLESIGSVDASAPSGLAGTWLLDPLNVTIRDRARVNTGTWTGYLFTSAQSGQDIYGAGYYPTRRGSIVAVDDIERALNRGTNVVVSTFGSTGSQPGNIYLEDDIRKTSGDQTYLGLHSVNNIYLSSGVDVISTSRGLYLDLWAPNGGIYGTNVGRIGVNGGTLHMEAQDGIDFHSRSDMPDNLTVGLNRNTRSRAIIDIEFDGDRIRFSHDGTTATIPTRGIVLDDSSSDGSLALYLYNLNLALEDRSIIIENQRDWFYWIDADRSHGAARSAALNGIPEVVTDGRFVASLLSEPPTTMIPVIEAAVNGSARVTQLTPTAVSGTFLIDAFRSYLASSILSSPIFSRANDQELAFSLEEEPLLPSVPRITSLASGPILWTRNRTFSLSSQTDISNSSLYVSEEWAKEIDYSNPNKPTPRWKETCLLVVYAMIEHALGNTDFRVGNPGTWTDADGAAPYPRERQRNLAPNVDTITKELVAGNPVILRSNSLDGEHFVLGVGLTPDGNVIALDPWGGEQVLIDKSTWKSTGGGAGESYTVQEMRTVSL